MGGYKAIICNTGSHTVHIYCLDSLWNTDLQAKFVLAWVTDLLLLSNLAQCHYFLAVPKLPGLQKTTFAYSSHFKVVMFRCLAYGSGHWRRRPFLENVVF